MYVQFSRSLIEPCFPILTEGNELIIIIVKITTIITRIANIFLFESIVRVYKLVNYLPFRKLRVAR